jgi:ATP-dependent Clp protease ATP-binding subunit ClpC
MLKPALSRGEIQCIGATTLDEYRKYIEKDGALERRFQTVMVKPPSEEEAVEILTRPARQVRGASPCEVHGR